MKTALLANILLLSVLGFSTVLSVNAAYEVTMSISEILPTNGGTVILQKPGTFVLKNNDPQSRTIHTDFAGNVTLAPGKEFRYEITDEGKYTFTIDNSSIKHEVIFTKPEPETDPQILERHDKIQQLENERAHLELRHEQIMQQINEIEQQILELRIHEGIPEQEAITPDQEAKLKALGEEEHQITLRLNQEIPKEIEQAKNEITDIKRGIVVTPPPTIDLDEIRNSNDTASWIKTLFTWHDKEMITTSDLVTVIKYLIEHEIIS